MRPPYFSSALLALGLSLLAPCATALTDLVYDEEPNDAPHLAVDLPLPAGKHAVRIVGELEGDDQDAFRVVVDEDLAGRRFDLELTGRGGALTRLDILDFTAIADGPGRIPEELAQRPRELAVVRSESGTRPTRVEGLLLAPGVYVFGVSHSGGTGGYSIELSQHDDATVRVVDGGHDEKDPGRFSTRGRTVVWTQGETWFEFELDEGDAERFHDLGFQAPLGRAASAALLDGDGNELLVLNADGPTATFRPGLKLPAGHYRIRSEQEQAGVQMFGFEAGAARAEAGREVEPNDRDPNEIAFGETISGRFDDGDTDWLSFEVDEEAAGRNFDLELSASDASRSEVCLMRQSIRLSHCVRGSAGMTALRDLGLIAGRYRLRLTERGEPGSDWQLRWIDKGERQPGEEVEPNDEPGHAAALHERGFGRGRFVGDDRDHWRFTVTGEPQLWRAQVQGDDLFEFALQDSTGRVLKSERAGRSTRVRLDNLFLLPGSYVLYARGKDADYILRLQPLGPPPEGMEREPNDGISDANPLRFGLQRFGTLAQANDSDHYRFSLNGHERVRITVQPPVDGSIQGTLAAGDETREISRVHNERDPGDELRWDLHLPPGDYSLQLSPHEPSDAEYTIDFERLDHLEPAVDREPNGAPESAAPFPADGRIFGEVGQNRRNHDWYELPMVEQPVALSLPRHDEVRARLVPAGDPGTDLFEYDRETKADTAVLEPGGRHLLDISGDGTYDFDLSDLAETPPGPPAPLEMEVRFERERVQAYSPWAQTLEAALIVSNPAEAAREVSLATHLTDVRWRIEGPASPLRLAAGESKNVPLVLRLPADLPDEPPVQFSAHVSDERGEARVRRLIRVEADAPPVAPSFHWAVPAALRGGINAASIAMGAEAVGGPGIDDDDIDETAALFDGLARIGNWTEYKIPARREGSTHHYAQPTVKLAGEGEVPVAGFLINPTASLIPHGFVHEFDIALSSDGDAFETVYSGQLQPIAEEQAFVLDQPVQARYARFIPKSSHFAYTNIGALRLGEFKVVARPDWRPDTTPFNLADPAHGGHLVRAQPWISGSAFDHSLLTIDGKAPTLRPRGAEQAEVVLGFHNARAARIDRIVMDARAEGEPERRPVRAAVAVALESPLGPWRTVAEAELESASNVIDLAAPGFARYLRLRFDLPEIDGWIELPDRIAVYEAAGESILGEWGFYEDAGPKEAADEPAWQALSGTPENTSRERSQALEPGQSLPGRALLDQYSAWYRIEVPAERNRLRLQVAGRPTVEARPRLFDAGGEEVAVHAERVDPAAHEWTAWVEPGGTYFVELYEPPRSVIFSWDTSASVGRYLPFIANALLTYAETIKPGRDEVNLLPFGRSRPLLNDWVGHAYPLMKMLSAYPHETSSSAAEQALAVAARELAGRPGKKAVVLLTDAATVTDEQLWPALAEGQPQVFAMKLSSEGAFGGNPVNEIDLMQDWARVRGGHFSYVTSFGALGRGFARAVTRLKAPVDFTLAAEFEQVDDPAPATIAVLAGESGEDLAPDARGAVEIILDASGSMLKHMGGERRIAIAKAALRRTVEDTLPVGIPLALRVYGHREAGSCRTDLEVPLSPLDKSSFLERVERIEAINLAKTPIAASLAAVGSDLEGVEGRRLVVLLTDGEETCDGDPAAEIAALKEAGVDIRVNIVGFAIDDEALKQRFAEWARLGDGEYLDAAEAEALPDAMDRALQVPFRVFDEAGVEVASGRVGGEPVSVPAGRYEVRVDTAATQSFRGVRLEPGEALSLELDAQ